MQKTPAFNDIMTDSTKAMAMQEYIVQIRELQQKYKNAILQMEHISQDLQEKAQKNSSYKAVAATVFTNVKVFKTTGENFFAQPITVESITKFQADTKSAFNALEEECKKHRGWHGVDAGVRKILGIFVNVLSLGIIPLINHFTKTGIGDHTFFNTSETNTAAAFKKVKKELDTNVQAIQTSHDMKAAIFALKSNNNNEPTSEPDISESTTKLP